MQSQPMQNEAGLGPGPDGKPSDATGHPPAPSARVRWRHAFGLASAYWTSGDWKFAWSALVALIGFQFGTAYIFVIANRWERNFFDSIERNDVARFGSLIFAFIGIMAMQVGAIVFEGWIDRLLSIRWRAFLTERYIDRWMARNRFAEIERLRIIDNPDQRIAADLDAITNGSTGILSIALGFIGATAGAISFIIILLETAEPIRFTAFGNAMAIPGSTVWYALAYAVIGSIFIDRVGRPYIQATMRQQHREADFRSNLMHVRRNAAQIGMAGAVSIERQSLRESFDAVRRNYRTIIATSLGLSATQSVYERIGTVLPLFLLVPRYFAGAISFGQVMGARDAFRQLVTRLSYFIQIYPMIGAQIANLNRIKGLDDAIDDERPVGIVARIGAGGDIALATAGLIVDRPNGTPLVTVGDWAVRRRERWAVCGASGTGKSTVLRALAGLWPDGSGSVAITRDTTVMIVPQRLYMPSGTLKAAVCFPDPPARHDDAAIATLLARVRLGALAGDLNAVRPWQDELSPGEQQRVALARILLHRPGLLILDEATSALDQDNAAYFHDCLLADLPDVTLVAVVHDTALLDRHTHILTIADGSAIPAPNPDQDG